jgi:peptidoglycan/xylan/chitin deacetylase (PgdA/CDA1 family)
VIKIINFHNVTNAHWLDQLIGMLKAQYKLIDIESLREHLNEKRISNNAVHITVDDGDISFYENIFPVLKKHQVPSSIFVSPRICKDGTNFWFQEIKGFDKTELHKTISEITLVPLDKIKLFEPFIILASLQIRVIHEIISRYQKTTGAEPKDGQNMTVEQLIEIRNSGLVNIGAHTLRHPILSNEDEETSNSEIGGSIHELSDILGIKTKTFAYPNGIPVLDFSEREIECLKNNAIDLAFSTEPKNISINDKLLNLPRYGLTYGSMFQIKAKLKLGPGWQRIRNTIYKSEVQERKKWKYLSSQYLSIGGNC